MSVNAQLFLDHSMEVMKWCINLPHWSQENKYQFITFRLCDSLPDAVIDNLKGELLNFEESRRKAYYAAKVERFLNSGYGSCLLANKEYRDILIQNLQYYNHQKYELIAYVIMPNHVHCLFVELEKGTLLKTISNIMRYTSRQINKLIGRRGTLWQKEPFDRMIRNEEHYYNTLEYIKANPQNLVSGSYAVGGIAFEEEL